METAIPEPVPYVPAAQGEQVDVDVIAAPVLYVPSVQREHTETAVSEL